MATVHAGALHVVATPIGNLGDLTARAREVLAGVDAICAEDTRHTRQLLGALGIDRPLIALHEHNEADMAWKQSGQPPIQHGGDADLTRPCPRADCTDPPTLVRHLG